MSIPLVQKAEKDDINTSIIAIKRNIERINMLLGLSNSEEIDTSKFATKEELQQAVMDLQPVNEVAVDNMHSVTSNAVAESLSYSTTEHPTGKKWIDGKDIYRIVVKDSNINSNTKTLYTITNLSAVVAYQGYYKSGNNIFNAWFANNEGFNWCRLSGNSLVWEYSRGISAPDEVTVILEYTKTTN